ncbi:MAG: nucleotide exchange factor GrpE [Oscillospiraceae bacterium]|nr:nucleotide exchange factor GrpE [Oscillospiraceae bacterium]
MSEEKEKELKEETVVENTEEAPSPKSEEKSKDCPKKDKKKKFEEKIETLEKEKADLSDRLLRKVAEFDNYRKRTEKEKLESVSIGKAAALEGILPVFDSLGLAMNAECSDENYKKGVELTLQMFEKALERLGVTQMDCLGKPFDPQFHNAVMTDPAQDGVESGTVTKVFQNGYMQGDKVLRCAMVAVSE